MSCNIVMYKNLRICALAYICTTPKPEVEIMMRNKKELKGFLLTATRLIVLALVFVTVFAVALTSDVVGSIGDEGVALAATEVTKDFDLGLFDGGKTVYMGKANAITGDKGVITAELLNFPGNTMNTWHFKDTFNSVIPHVQIASPLSDQPDNFSANNIQIYKPKSKAITCLDSGDANSWGGGVTDGQAAGEVELAINFAQSAFINALLATGRYTVTATITANYEKTSGTNNMFWTAVVGTKPIDAKDSYDMRQAKKTGANSNDYFTWDFEENSSSPQNGKQKTVELTKERPYLALAFGVGWSQRGSSTRLKVWAKNITVDYTVKLNDDANDNAAPVESSAFSKFLPNLENSYVKGTSGSGYAPYVTKDNMSTEAPVYFDSIKKYIKTDSVSDGNVKLLSYASKAIDKIEGHDYYKFAQTEYVDMFNYTGQTFEELIKNATKSDFDKSLLSKFGAGDKVLSESGGSYSWSNASNEHFINSTGIKTVQVGDTVFDIYNSSGTAYSAQTKEITVTDTEGNVTHAGYATITRTNRARVVVSVYFTTNVTLQTVVTDFSGLSVTTRLEISGIDTSLNDNGTPISDNDYIKANAPGSWLYSNLLEVGSEFENPDETDAANYSPRLWFFTVKRADEFKNLGTAHVFNSLAELLASGLKPIGVDDGFAFNYDFETGKARSYGSANYDAIGTLDADGKVTSESAAKGHGYYIFTFYTIDLAGNLSATTSSYYSKVDFDTPNYSVDLSYILKADNSKHTIKAADNGTWAKGATTLDIMLGALGFSGNTLVFEDLMGYHVFKFDNAIVNGVNTSSLASYYYSHDGGGTVAVENDEVAISVTDASGKYNVAAKYIYDASKNSGTLRFVINAESIEWITAFTLYTGSFATIDDMDSHQGNSYIDAAWVGGVKVLIDTIAPVDPEFVSGDDNQFSKKFEDYSALPSYSDRQWYTGAYDKYVASIAFTDVFLSSEYGKDVKVYYGIKVVQNRAELAALGEKGIEGVYGSITDNTANYFDRLQYIGGSDISSEGDTAIENGAMNIVNVKVGMRVIYVWAVDQAGNVSNLKTYYILADNTTYTLNAKVGKNSVADSEASINSVDEEGNALTKFSRGDIATLNTVLGDDFVPFALTLTVNGNANKVLYNYMPSRDWTISDADNEDYINYAQNDSVKLAIDDKDNLGMLDNAKTLDVEFAYRKVVDYTVTNYSVAYNSRPITVEMTFTDSASAASFEYRYFDKNGVLLTAAPVNPGDYFVEIYIDKNNENYVTADFTMDGEGNQTFKRVRVAITKGRIVISAVETSAKYGEDLTNVLKYTVSGIALEDMAKEGITQDMLALALDVADYSPTGFYSVGFYNVVLKNNKLVNEGVGNYDITFMTAQHRVTQRNISIYAQAATKFYGDPDPKFYFGVKADDLAFNGAKTAQDILDEIFDKTTYTSAGSKDGFYLYEAGDRITRTKGEEVWASYTFNSDASLFDVNSNYKITLQTLEVFSITQRQVEIGVGGQSKVVKSSVTPSSDGIVPSYTLDAKDAFLADLIAELLEGKLSLAENGTVLGESDYDTNKYQGATGFKILLANIDNKNIAISLKSQENYVIYIAKAGTVIIKANKEFTYVYGEIVHKTNTYNTDDFTYECDDESVVFDRVEWTMLLSHAEEYIKVGRYVATFSNVKLFKDKVELTDVNVEVEPVIVNITPAQIQIRPTASTFTKVYGEADSVYGIGFEIVKVNGEAIAKDGEYAGLSYNELLASVSGSFARARYNKDGNFTAYGTRYDNVLTDDNYYYGYVVNKAFAINDENFVVNAAVDGEYANARFEIAPKKIAIHTKDIVGVSKYYNGNDAVDYDAAGVTMYDLTSQLVLATDKVKLVANDMKYTVIGDGKNDVASHIVLGGFVLTGEQSANYTLAYIVNDGHTEGVKVKGDKDGDNFVIVGTTVEIAYIDNSNSEGAKDDYIYILFKRIGVEKNDVTIVKEYDNTNVLYADNVIIAKSDDHKAASTAMLIGAKKTLIAEESGVFSGVKAGEGYLITRVKLVFTFESGNLSESSVYDYKDNDVDIRVVGNTIELTVRNVKATIAKKKLNASSFASVAPVSRDYNSTASVDVNYTYADGALVTGDSVESVGLKLVGEANGKDFGQHQVVISAENTKVSNANYEVDVNDINNNFAGLTVEIEKARLMPNVLFESKVYDNTTNVNVTNKGGSDFTTLYYADNLRAELAQIHMMSGKVEYKLSAMGAPDANVAVDADGNEIGHNVMVSGLAISADDTSILKNYRIYGSVYNSGSGYMAFEDAQVGTVADYEILQAVKVSKKTIKLITNDFQIAPKVYDGSVKATITIQVPVNGGSGNRVGVLEEHKDLLEIVATGTFSSAKVGKNIKVTVSAPQLKSKNGIDNTIVNNYYLDKSAGAGASNVTGTIIERPVAVEVDLGERIYNGYSEIVKNKLRYTMDGIIESEARNYNVATVGGAYFIDKNVVLDANREVDFKEGNVYNPMFTNMGGFDINYVITYKTNVREKGRDADILAYEDNDGVHYYPQSVPSTAIAYYYSLRTVSKYVDDADYEDAKDYIVGRYKVNGAEVYLVSDDYAGGKDLGETMTYITGKGKINQRDVYITANSIEKLNTEVAEKMFRKQYDGTTKFYGTVEGKNAATDAYRLTSTGIANVIKGDDVHIANVSAEYNSANTNAMYVVFTASGLDGKDKDNYTIENKNSGASSDSFTAKLTASIQKRTVTASLQDGEMVYGTSLGNVGGDVEYYINDTIDEAHKLVWVDKAKSFFILTSTFMESVGMADNAENAKYLAQIDAYTYNLVDGEYVKAADGERGEYFRLGGETGNAITNLPKPTARFSTGKPNAGDSATAYYLTGGSANNFAFKTRGTDGDNSKLVVTKRTLYVTTAGINHVKTYAGTDPAIDLLFDGVASNDTLNIFVDSKGVDYRPVVVLAVYNSETGEYTPAGKYAKTSDTLGKNEYYVYYLTLPSGLESYNDFAPISNYNVVIGDASTLKAIAVTDESGNVVKDTNGKDAYEFAYSFASGAISKKASTITIKLPEMDGISVDTTNNTFTYTYDKASGKGVNRVYDVLKGAKVDDEVRYIKDGEEKEASDAGTHTGFVYVKRFVKVDNGDTNGYFIEWRSSEEVTIVIEKASAQLKAAAAYVYYNGKAQSYPVNCISVHEGIKGGLSDKNFYEMSYKIYKNGQYEDVLNPADIKNAGTYIVTFRLTDEFEKKNSNYKKEEVVSKFVINQVVVNVTIDKTGYSATTEVQQDKSSVTKLRAAYDANGDYSIGYSVAMGDGYKNNSAIEITKAMTKLAFAKGSDGNERQITGAGKYSFTVSITDENIAGNYALVGNAGVLELTANSFDSDGGSVKIDGDGIVANRLAVRDITDSIVANDINYVAVIKQFMPALSAAANLKDEARVAAVVKMELYCDNQLVVLDGETTSVSVAIPSTVRKDMKGIALYTVTKDGTLKKLTDYNVNNGRIEYSTDYVSALVFVDVNPPSLEPWEIGVTVGTILVVLIIVVACVVGVIVRKKHLQKLI